MANDLSKTYGSPAIFAGSAVGGAVLGNIASAKISMFNGVLGRLIIIVLGIILIAKSKSDALKGVGCGLCVSGAQGFISQIAGTVSGFEGLAGLGYDGDLDGDYDDLSGVGVGELVTGPDGMLYMMNGMGALEPYYGELSGDGVGEVDYDIVGASGMGALDPAMAAA